MAIIAAVKLSLILDADFSSKWGSFKFWPCFLVSFGC